MWDHEMLTRDQGQDHPVQVIEERDQVQSELDETLLLVARQGTEDLGGVVHVVLGQDPVKRPAGGGEEGQRGGLVVSSRKRGGTRDVLVDVVPDQRSVDEERYPLSGQQEAEGEESVGEHLGEDELFEGVVSRRKEAGGSSGSVYADGVSQQQATR